MFFRIVYDIVLTLVFVAFSTGVLARALVSEGRVRENLRTALAELSQRFGYGYRDTFSLWARPVYWIHAASAGEIVAARPLIENIIRLEPDSTVLVTTVTRAGFKMANSIKEVHVVSYLPIDISWVIRRFLKRIRPRLLILLESEFWPNLITLTKSSGAAVVVVNNQMSDRSYRKNSRLRHLWLSIAKNIDKFCVQSVRDRERLMALGIAPNNVVVTGNMKYDSVVTGSDNRHVWAALRDELKLKEEDIVFVAGSTHDNEEELLLQAFQDLRTRFPRLVLLLAPRHVERCAEVVKLFEKNNVDFVRRTSINERDPERDRVILLDTLGELSMMYKLADVVFVGGSFVPVGGHNILEPAAVGKAILFGPHMFNFVDTCKLFLERQAAIQVENIEQLVFEVDKLLNDPEKLTKLGENARQIVEENRGAVNKTLEVIREVINP